MRGHGADREQLVSDLEQVLQQRLGIVVVVLVGDPLLQPARFAGECRHQVDLTAHQGRADRVGQFQRRVRVNLVPLDPVQHLPGVDERDVGVDDRVERAVHRDEIVGSDELVELDVVHVTAAPELGSMQHHEHLVVIDVHLRDVIAFDAVADREVMEAEQVRQHGRLPGLGGNG